MEKKIKLFCNANVKDLIINNKVLPGDSENVDVELRGSELIIQFKRKIKHCKRIYTCFLDKNGQQCYGFIEGSLDDRNRAYFEFDMGSLIMFNDKMYYRVGVVFEYENEYSCCFISSQSALNNKSNKIYYGSLLTVPEISKTLAVFFSQAGRLSVKLTDTEDFNNNFYTSEITSVSKNEDGFVFCLGDSDVKIDKVYFLSQDGTSRIPLEVSYKKNSVYAVSQFSDFSDKEFNKYEIKLEINNSIIDLSWSDKIEISGFSVYQPLSFYNGKINAYLVFDSNKDTFSFHYCEKYYDYAFSIITAVYNTAPFVEETIKSILAQDLAPLYESFENNASAYIAKPYELILVDDGSTDGSSEICDRYAMVYPQIKVIHKENGGVSSARNLGIKHSKGKYLNFLDSDDKFQNNVLSECFNFFEENYNQTNMITFPIKFFDGAEGDHWLNFKFSEGSRIIDFTLESDKPAFFVNASMFKAEAIKDKIFFDENLRTGEDLKFIYSIFLGTTAKIGVVNSCKYLYRRRTSGEASAINQSKSTKCYYTDNLKSIYYWLVEYSKKNYGIIPNYIQYAIMADLQWRFLHDGNGSVAKTVLSDEEYEAYKKDLINLLQYIDTKIIIQQKKIYREHKLYILKLKLQRNPDKFFINNDIVYSYDGNVLSNVSTNYIKLEAIQIKNGHLRLEGFNMSFEENQEFFICVNGQYYSPAKINRNNHIYSLSDPIFFSYPFIFDFDLNRSQNVYNVTFCEKFGDRYVQKASVRFGKFFPITKTFTKSYYFSDNWISRIEDNALVIKNTDPGNFSAANSLSCIYEYEQELENQIIRSSEYNKEEIKEALELRKKTVYFRNSFKFANNKKIWLISDRSTIAGDNGEAFFIYLSKINDPDIDVYFVIEEDCADYERMKQYGKVVVQNSDEHKVLHLLADYIISSQALEYIFNPFSLDKTSDVFRDIINDQKFIFLQHGITKDDVSDWLNKYNKNIFGFITAAQPEAKSILDYDYYYTEEEVWLTGFPRHDRLYNDNKKYITVMPTWRKYLCEDDPNNPGITNVKEDFLFSDYFDFYNKLLNHEKLIKAANKYGYKICFRPHPFIMGSLDKFNRNPDVIFFDLDKPYREIYAESDLVVTDYSSSVMDFAYLRKPVVYCQFDREEFFSGKHTYVEGYYDYDTDGFGEVTYNLDDAVDMIIKYMKDGCELKPVYKERMDRFFAFGDKNNCERLYKKIKSFDD